MADDQSTAGSFIVTIDGAQLPDWVAQLLTSAVVDRNLNSPDLFALRFRDPDRQVLKASGAHIGSRVIVKVFSTVSPGGVQLLSGDLTALETEYEGAGTFVVIRGYDESHRLFRGRKSLTFQNVTYADVAKTVAQRAGLTAGQIDPTTPVYEWLAQDNCNDWQFLRRLAADVGFELTVADGQLNFCQPVHSSTAPAEGSLTGSDSALQLTMGVQVLKLRGVVTSADQVANVEVRGWDPKAKQAIVSTAPAGTTSASTALSPQSLAGTWGPSTLTSVGVPHVLQSEADQAAKALADQVGGSFAELDGVARGNAQLAPGKAVSLSLAGDPFDGQYVLTTATHRFDPHDGYTTAFTVSGKNQRSLLGLASNAVPASQTRISGVVSAIVTDVADPDNLGRAKITFPWLSDSYASDWVRVAQAGAGNNRGAVFLPEVGDEVVVAFDHGDVRFPIVLSSLYNGVDKPNLGANLVDATSGAVNRRGIVSKAGHALIFFDADGDAGIALMSGDKSVKLSLNQTSTTIKLSSNGVVEIDAKSDMNLTASGNVTIKSQGNISLQSDGGIDIHAGNTVEVKGSQILLN